MTWEAVCSRGYEAQLAAEMYRLPGLTWRGVTMRHRSPAQWAKIWSPHQTFALQRRGVAEGYAVFAVDMRPSSGLWFLDLAIPRDEDSSSWRQAYDAAVSRLRQRETVCRVFCRAPELDLSTIAALAESGWECEGRLAGQFLINHRRCDAQQWAWTEQTS